MAQYDEGPTAPTGTEALTAHARYQRLDTLRSPYLMRAREAATLTIPALMPPEGHNGTTKLPTPYQSVGARGLLNLASKLLLALFPPGSAFFRLTLDEKIQEAVLAASNGPDDDPLGDLQKALSKMESRVTDTFEEKGVRVPLHASFKQLLNSGNVLLQILADGRMLAHHLDRYVVKRDSEGKPLDIVLKQCLSRTNLPERVKKIVDADTTSGKSSDQSADNTIDLYTRVTLEDGQWVESQEVCGVKISDAGSTYPLDASPWLPLALNLVPGEDYGRGHIEEYIGDLHSLESLRQSIVEFAGQAAKIIWLVNESGVTDKKKLARAPSGTVMDGNIDDVKALMLEKFADFQVAKATADDITRSLGECFLLGSAARRDAERVTAEEVRLIAGELEQALGGLYSVLTQELQAPLVKRYLLIMQKSGKLPALPKNAVSPQIVTGLSALGRNADLQKLDALVAGLGQLFGPEAVAEYVNAGAYAKRRGAAIGLDTDGLVRSEADVQARREQQQKQALVEKLGPQVIKNQGQAPAGAQPAGAAPPQS